MRVHYPPIGIAHITNELQELFDDRLSGAKAVQCACIMQPKADPHFGTMVTVMTTFAIAAYVQRGQRVRTSVLIDALENAPHRPLIHEGREYTLCLSHAQVDGRPAAEKYMEPIVELATWLGEQAAVEWRVRWYRESQGQTSFRLGLVEMLRREHEFAPALSPSERRLRVRPICSRCGIVEKRAVDVVFADDVSYPRLIGTCPNCGILEVGLFDETVVVDANTPIRTVLRSLCFIQERERYGRATLVVNGGDWSGMWMQRVYGDGLALLGYSGIRIPLNIFVPLILDESGAKLSKTIYLEKGAYDDLDPAWVSVSAFRSKYGEAGLQAMWKEVSSWVREPKRLFRDYSIRYIQALFEA